eukprot:Tbor_TRINITY_DN2887_c0_g1::TRINITY_DN2887_c0_g1_i1::g.23218::m.23218
MADTAFIEAQLKRGMLPQAIPKCLGGFHSLGHPIQDITDAVLKDQNLIKKSAMKRVKDPNTQGFTGNKTVDIFDQTSEGRGKEHVANNTTVNGPFSANTSFQQNTSFSSHCGSSGSGGPAVQHLLKQIRFLHSEVERLEKDLSDSRMEAMDNMQMMFEKNKVDGSYSTPASIFGPAGASRRLQAKQEEAAAYNISELSSRCKQLEGQLAAAVSEKNVLSGEKCDMLAKIMRLERGSKDKGKSLVEVQNTLQATSEMAKEEVVRIKAQMAELLKENGSLKKSLEGVKMTLATELVMSGSSRSEKVSSYTQCFEEDLGIGKKVMQAVSLMTDPPVTSSMGCQVETLVGDEPLAVAASTHFAEQGRNISEGSKNNLTHMLQIRCAELDTTRSDLYRLSEVHKETLQYLDVTKKRLHEELEQRKNLESENEKLLLQFRAQQQQVAQLAAQNREKDSVIEEQQSQTEEAIRNYLRLEHERSKWENELSANAKDMQNLVTNQNFVHQQLSNANKENDELRSEIQRLMQIESQTKMSLRAKDVELGEILQAYQNSVQEGESHINNCNILEKEAENLRASLSVKEDRLIHLQEQVSQLHAREQQLTVDLQSFDYEGGQLHRKLVRHETTIAQMNAQLYDCQQHHLAMERVHQELERNNAELSKQLVIRDNECMHLRSRCDNLEQECTALHTARNAEVGRLQELEDRNAQQAVKEILKRQDTQQSVAIEVARLQKELADLSEANQRGIQSINELHEKNVQCERYRAYFEKAALEEKERADQLEKTKNRLESLLKSQAEALSRV